MRIALLQVASPQQESAADRRRRVADMVRSAQGADMIVLPELWVPGYFAFESYEAEAEPLDGPTITLAAALAGELRTMVHIGSIVERVGHGPVRNTAVLIGSDGSVLHSYSKIHVFGYQSREAELLQPGDSVSVSATQHGGIASMTCYDLRFPELWRRSVDAGAEIVVVPAAWPAARVDHWKLFTATRAVEQQVFVLACNAVGAQSGKQLGGHSRVIDPWGDVLAEAGTDEGITWCDLTPTAVQDIRAEFPVLQDRLTDYGRLATKG